MGLTETALPILAIDLGTINVKASLFDAVSGQYSLVAAAQATGGPYSRDYDFYTPFFQAIKGIESQTGRILLDAVGRILVPVTPGLGGVGRVIITGSTGPKLRAMLVGLLPEVSLQSAVHLVQMNYGEVVHQIGLHNQLPVEKQVDASIPAKPDVILICGGGDSGCQRSLLNHIEFVRLFCSLLPEHERPQVVFAGSQACAQTAVERLSGLVKVRSAPNLRPSYEVEDLDPAHRILQDLASAKSQKQSETLAYLGRFCKGAPISASHSFGRAVRYLSKMDHAGNGVIGIDIGTETTTIAGAENGKLNMQLLPFGMGERMAEISEDSYLSGIKSWLPPRISRNKVRDYLWQKSLNPGTIPADSDSLAIEQAAAREIIRLSVQELDDGLAHPCRTYGTIIAAGSVIADAPSLDQSLLMLLDGIEPVGISSIYLDPYSILPAMGAAAPDDPTFTVQGLDSFLSESLATVISPTSWAPAGTTIMKIRVEDGEEILPEVKIHKGEIVRLDIPSGKLVTLHARAGLHTWLDPVKKIRSVSLEVRGGMLGVIIDGRGRPLHLPISAGRRWRKIHKWSESIQK